jgi:hypothetical protein
MKRSIIALAVVAALFVPSAASSQQQPQWQWDLAGTPAAKAAQELKKRKEIENDQVYLKAWNAYWGTKQVIEAFARRHDSPDLGEYNALIDLYDVAPIWGLVSDTGLSKSLVPGSKGLSDADRAALISLAVHRADSSKALYEGMYDTKDHRDILKEMGLHDENVIPRIPSIPEYDPKTFTPAKAEI